MKKSNILVLVAVIILLISLISYNTVLRAAYLSGAYKNPNKSFQSINLKGFDKVAIKTNNGVQVIIQQGDFQVRVLKVDKDYIKFKQAGNLLTVDVSFPENYNFRGGDQVIINLPVLNSLVADTNPNHPPKPKNAQVWEVTTVWSYIHISNFVQDSLFIKQGEMTEVNMLNNKLAYLKAITGESLGSPSTLNILEINKITQASLDIRNKSTLSLQNLVIPNLTYQFSDSAQVNMSGAALALLKK